MNPYILIQMDCDSEHALSMHYSGTNTEIKKHDVFYKAIDIFLYLLNKYTLKATFFVVGKDLESPAKIEMLKKVITAGHEIANHTYTHPNNLSQMSINSIYEEVQETNRIIYNNLGVKPLGFRAPNFDISCEIIETISRAGMLYDCSHLSTPWKPLFRLIKGLDPFRSNYLGGHLLSEYQLFRSNKWKNPNNVLEIPITVFPWLKFPCNLSYILALPESIASSYFDLLCNYHIKTSNKKPFVWVLHLSDFVDNKYLFKTEAKYYKSLQRRLFFIDEAFAKVAGIFTSITTIDYMNIIEREKS